MFNIPSLPNTKYVVGAVIALVVFVVLIFLVIFTIKMLISDDESSEFTDLLDLANSKL